MTDTPKFDDAIENDGIIDGVDNDFDPYSEKISAVCFTGHRIISENVKNEVETMVYYIIQELYYRGARIFKAGGAIGFDTIAEQAVLKLREETQDSDIELHLYLAAPGQSSRFSAVDKAEYDRIKEKSDLFTYAAERISTESYYARNRALVDGSDVCVAYCTKPNGGSYYTCNYALTHGVEFINIADLI